jgi:hypothetical protein
VFPTTLYRRTSEIAVKAKFAEYPFHALGWIGARRGPALRVAPALFEVVVDSSSGYAVVVEAVVARAVADIPIIIPVRLHI